MFYGAPFQSQLTLDLDVRAFSEDRQIQGDMMKAMIQ